MAPQRNNDRHSGHTGTIPKSKVRNNCNVPQEAVTPTRRDMSSNLVSTSLDWVPVSEYNSRSNYNQSSRKPANNSSDHELTDLDNTVSFESGYGRFVPVRPQPRVLPLNVQNRENLTADHHDDNSVPSVGYSLHPYAQHPMPNGTNPHSNHAAAAVMIVNPTTPNAIAGNMSQPFNGHPQSSSRNNLTRNLNPARNNNFDGNSNPSSTPPIPNSRAAPKTVNLMNNMYEQGQGSSSNLNEHSHAHRESARALGEAIVAACPDAAAVERRLSQIREYIRVTSSLVDTMRNSEDEAFIEHTKEEYDELVGMVMKLKESETKLEHLLVDKEPDNVEVPAEETDTEVAAPDAVMAVEPPQKPTNNDASSPLRKVTNQENEQLNKTLHTKPADDVSTDLPLGDVTQKPTEQSPNITEKPDDAESSIIEIQEIDSMPLSETDNGKEHMNVVLRQNILSCVEKVALIEELKSCLSDEENQDVVVRPMSVQSNGSGFSENELWPNEMKNKMELSQQRLAALKQQQRRLLKYQAETKQQLEEMNRAQSQEILAETSHDNLAGFQRMHAANQIGVATTLPHAADGAPPPPPLDDTYSHGEPHIASSEEAGGGRDSEPEESGGLGERRRQLAEKLRDLQLKKQHMENMVSEFQKLQMATRLGSSHNTYFSSGEESADEEPAPKCSNSGGNMKNEDPFKLMEIKAIKTALQKTKDLMRSVENYEADNLSGVHEDPYQMQNHSNIHDNKSEGGASTSGWSNDGSVCRVRNALQQRHKFTNEQQHHQQIQQHQQQLQQQQQQLQHQQQLQQQQQQLQQQQQHQQLQQQHQQQRHQVQSHEQNIASLQELAQELRMETEKIMGERARLKDMVSNKEFTRKQKKVNEEVRPSTSAVGPAERRQMELRNLLAEKQKELEALLKKEKVLCVGSEGSNQGVAKSDSRAASLVNQSYNSEQEEPDSRSEQILMESQNSREIGNFRGGDSGLGGRSMNTLPSHHPHMGSTYASDSDSPSRTKSNQRNRGRRRQTQERQIDDSNMQQSNSINQMRLEPRIDAPNVNTVPPIPHAGDSQNNMPYQHMPQSSSWGSCKSNQSNDMRANQFTQNSHSQTMGRLLSTPHAAFPPNPPSMPFNMMMPFGVGGCACGCALWGAWCWQQLQLQQRDVQQLRDQLSQLEERWRAETASHTLNNQVPPGNRANNYWDNFRSYSRQNLLSGNSKANADGQPCGAPAAPPLHHHHPPPLAARSHNALHAAPPPHAAPPHPAHPPPPRNVAERSLSFSSAPDVLNLNQHDDAASPAPAAAPPQLPPEHNVNINRQDPASYRNLNIANSIPEIIQTHANNINTSTNTLSKKKSSSKLPAKNSGNRRNNALDYCQASNINIASTSEAANPNLASTSYEHHDKATTKFFDLLRENVYSEVTALIGANESHPDFLIQLFRDLQLISSDSLRQKVLQSIRGVLSQYPSIVESQASDNSPPDENTSEAVSTTTNEASNNHEHYLAPVENASNATIRPVDNGIVRFLLLKSEEICSQELMEMLATLIVNNCDSRQQLSKKRLMDLLSKYEGSRVCDVSGDILESLSHVISGNENEEFVQNDLTLSESSILQDVAGSLNLFSSSDTQLHQLSCPYDMWHIEAGGGGGGGAVGRGAGGDAAGNVDLINCAEMLNGELAEADQTCPEPAPPAAAAAAPDALPDVVDTDEATPTEAEAEWLGLDRVPTRLHMEESSEKQKD